MKFLYVLCSFFVALSAYAGPQSAPDLSEGSFFRFTILNRLSSQDFQSHFEAKKFLFILFREDPYLEPISLRKGKAFLVSRISDFVDQIKGLSSDSVLEAYQLFWMSVVTELQDTEEGIEEEKNPSLREGSSDSLLGGDEPCVDLMVNGWMETPSLCAEFSRPGSNDRRGADLSPLDPCMQTAVYSSPDSPLAEEFLTPRRQGWTSQR